MSAGRIVIGTRRYSSWSLRGWLAVRIAGLDVADEVIPLAAGGTEAIRDATPGGTVPALFHDGRTVWESLAICEYCAEFCSALWPADPAARARARSIAAAMHAGFVALRRGMPMNLGRERPLAGGIPEAVAADIAAVAAIWRDTRARHAADGPFLFGATFGAADAMYAPVVTRLHSYAAVPDGARPYVDAVRAHPLMREWAEAAAAEPAAWRLPHYETVD